MARKSTAEVLNEALAMSPTKEKEPDIPDPPHSLRTVVDQTHIVNGQWPGNPPQRTGNYYFDLNRLTLKQGESGLMGALADNFVYERVDVHVIRPSDGDCQLELSCDPDQLLDGFLIKGREQTVIRQDPPRLGRIPVGMFMGRKPVYLTLHDDPPKKGRIVVNFVGYLIEPWR